VSEPASLEDLDMAIELDKVSQGDVVTHWFDTGAFGYAEVFSRVLKVGKRKLRVRTESGSEGWKYPEYFNRIVPPAEVPELKIQWR
jgi:hypothetical protein